MTLMQRNLSLLKYSQTLVIPYIKLTAGVSTSTRSMLDHLLLRLPELHFTSLLGCLSIRLNHPLSHFFIFILDFVFMIPSLWFYIHTYGIKSCKFAHWDAQSSHWIGLTWHVVHLLHYVKLFVHSGRKWSFFCLHWKCLRTVAPSCCASEVFVLSHQFI